MITKCLKFYLLIILSLLLDNRPTYGCGSNATYAEFIYAVDSINPRVLHILVKTIDGGVCSGTNTARIVWSKGPGNQNARYYYLPLIDTFHVFDGGIFEVYKGDIEIDSVPLDSLVIIGYRGGDRVPAINYPPNAYDIYAGSVINLSSSFINKAFHSPEFQAYPLAIGSVYDTLHYDPYLNPGDGDSVYVEFVTPGYGYNWSIIGYELPSQVNHQSDTIYTNSDNGAITWTPIHGQGDYVIAIRASQFKHGVYTGSIIRDMLIHIVPNDSSLSTDNDHWSLIDSIVRSLETYTPASPSAVYSVVDLSPLRCYPSPTSGTFTIDMSAYDPSERQIYIYDQLGQVVYQTTTTEEQLLVSAPLASGLYTVSVTQGTQRDYVRVVIE